MDASRFDDRAFASFTVPNRVESIRMAAAFLVQAAKDMRVPPASDVLFELAIVEALNNAVRHGNTAQRDGALIVCEIELAGQLLTVRILDQGPGFELQLVRRPEVDGTEIRSLPESGYGISIIQNVFPTVRTIWRAGEFGLEMSLQLPEQ